ncbi:MAG: DUF1648 domain-containing protein [Planctomycetes bacterium]|nr:DUF1648 domain-containing protein [Planctomycetota bacterium]
MLALACLPLVGLAAYLAHVYPQLPASIATTFDGAGKPIAYSSKQAWLFMTLGLVVFLNVSSTGPLFLGLHRGQGTPAQHLRVERFMAGLLFALNGLQLLWAHVLAAPSLPRPWLVLGVVPALGITAGVTVALTVAGFACLRRT